jgi:hypothetical protein
MNRSTRSISRRRFLQLAIWLSTFGLTVTVPPSARSTTGVTLNFVGRKLTRSLVDKRSAHVIGRQYLKIHPEEASVDLLIRLLCCDRSQSLFALANEGDRVFRKLILAQQRDDFAKSRTVNLKGWILAKTEARLCALVTLL